MPTANIYVRNVATVRVQVEVRDLNDNDELAFELDPQEVSGPIELEPHPEQLDYQMGWTATANGYFGEGDAYVEDGETVDITVSPVKVA